MANLNKAKTDYLEKGFVIKGVPADKECWRVITRGDYEGLPCPMCAWTWTDGQMQRLADAISDGFDYKSLCEALADVDEQIAVERINEVWWSAMEECAKELGMQYYEDFTDEEMRENDKAWEKFQPL